MLIQEAVTQLLTIVQQYGLGLFVALTGVGTLTMAFIQLIKDLTPSWRFFQQRWFERWFQSRCIGLPLNPDKARQELRHLIELGMGGEVNAFYELPIEQFRMQLDQVMQSLLDYPTKYPMLIRILARHAIEDEALQEDADLDLLILLQSSESHKASTEDYLDARTRVKRRIQTNLQSLQLNMGRVWRRLLHWISIFFSGVIILVAMLMYGANVLSIIGLGFALLTAFVSGFVAPFARDVVAALSSLRR